VEPITVAVVADRAFSRQLAVVLAGISRCSAGAPYRVFVLHDGYEPELVGKVEPSAGPDVAVEWLDARTTTLDQGLRPDHITLSALYRLRLGEVLPADVDRVLYLDADIVVRNSLGALWTVDLGDSILAAVRDPVLGWFGSPNNVDWRHFGIDPAAPYFNAGIMLIDLDAWRRDDFGSRTVELVTSHPFLDADQGALNVAAVDRWVRLPPHWNLQGGHLRSEQSHAWVVEPTDALDLALQTPSIVHYNGGKWRRPWEDRLPLPQPPVHPMRQLWFEDLDRTAWAGWRPVERRASRMSGISRRIVRAGRTLAGNE